jgi:hypothetical protein
MALRALQGLAPEESLALYAGWQQAAFCREVGLTK